MLNLAVAQEKGHAHGLHQVHHGDVGHIALGLRIARRGAIGKNPVVADARVGVLLVKGLVPDVQDLAEQLLRLLHIIAAQVVRQAAEHCAHTVGASKVLRVSQVGSAALADAHINDGGEAVEVVVSCARQHRGCAAYRDGPALEVTDLVRSKVDIAAAGRIHDLHDVAPVHQHIFFNLKPEVAVDGVHQPLHAVFAGDAVDSARGAVRADHQHVPDEGGQHDPAGQLIQRQQHQAVIETHVLRVVLPFVHADEQVVMHPGGGARNLIIRQY